MPFIMILSINDSVQPSLSSFFRVFRVFRGYLLSPMRGKFITLEGPEGSGKSTQVKALVQRLAERGIEAITTREPGGTALGEEIRNILQHNQAGEAPCERAELLLFEASRNQLVEKVIRPALEKGIWVICDRFIDSTTAYQGFGRGLPVDEVKAINRFTINGVSPDLTLLLDLEVSAGFERIARRHLALGESADRFEQEECSFHEKVRAGYLKLAAEEPERSRIVNAAQEPDAVASDIWKIIEEMVKDEL
jgi:dTMP kinase